MATADTAKPTVDNDDEQTALWLERLSALVEQVEGWAKELDWSTRRIETTMGDRRSGQYEAPALLLQKETVRLYLNPIAKDAPGEEGIVDLYLMPGYDDVARFFLLEGGWLVRFVFDGSPSVAKKQWDHARPFDQPTLEAILDEMMKNGQ